MKLMNCPLNGPRNITEFVCYGEIDDMPEPNDCNDRDWADYTWFSNNTAGVVREWWCHVPTAYWFVAERDTVTDEIHKTYAGTELFSTRREFKGAEST